MIQTLSPIWSKLWRLAVVLLSLEVSIVSLRYLTESDARVPFIVSNAFAKPFLILHVVGGITALLLGPLQFVGRLRLRAPALHRVSGRMYVGGCALGTPAALMLALGTKAGPVTGTGFAIPAVLCPLFTYLGWRSAIEQRLREHRDWMVRSYALISTAITLRLMLPLSGMLGFEFMPAYHAISWLGWMTNLALAEAYLCWEKASGSRRPGLANG